MSINASERAVAAAPRPRRFRFGGPIAFAAAAIAVVCACLAINAADEALSPEAERMLAPRENPYEPQDNLYVAFAGFTAPAGASTIREGQARIARRDRIARLPMDDRDAAQEALARPEPDALAFRGTLHHCRPVLASCWQRVERSRAAIEQLLAANAELYRRYVELHALPGYFDTAQPSVPAPLVLPHPSVWRLFLSNVALRAQDDAAEQRSSALSDLDADIRMWGRVLRGEGSLDSKLIALDHLYGDYALLGHIAGTIEAFSEHRAGIEAALSRLSRDDWKIGAAVESELRSVAAWLHDFHRDSRLSHLFKINATRNLGARHMLHVQRLIDADAQDHAAELAALRAWRARHFETGIGSVYNPIGKALLGVAPEAYERYALRVYDIAGLLRLVRLGFEVRTQGVADDDLPAFIKEHARASHPLSGTPFVWHAATRELVMEPVADINRERPFRVPVK